MDQNGVLYGAAWSGGTGAGGVVYQLNRNGTGFQVLHSFANSGPEIAKGYHPWWTLLRDENGVLYGTTPEGGTGAGGVLYKLTPPIGGGQWTLEVLHSFAISGPDLPNGYRPYASLIRDQNSVLYGTTTRGGHGAGGVVFKLKRTGQGFTVLHDFANSGPLIRGGYSPHDLTIGQNGVLYGTAYDGGTGTGGVVYRLNRSGSGFAVLHSFANSGAAIANGYHPFWSLLGNLDGVLYGTTYDGGTDAGGVVYQLKRSGSGFAVLNSFANSGPGLANGYNPYGSLVMDRNGLLYGATEVGGTGAGGVVYKLTP